MLAFIYTKNKVIRDEEITENDIFEIQSDKGGRISKSPEWLGLNPKKVDIDWDDGKFDENKKQGILFFVLKKIDYIGEFQNDSTVIEFDKMRREIKEAELQQDQNGFNEKPKKK